MDTYCVLSLGRKSYLKHLDEIYKESDISWFTPVELYKASYPLSLISKMPDSVMFR